MHLLYIKFITLFLLLTLLSFQANSQTLFTPASNLEISSNSEIQVYWSLGEPCISTGYTDNLYFTEGFHQPLKQPTPLANYIRLESVRVYPTLAENVVYLDTESYVSEEKIKYTVYTTQGKIIREGVLDPSMLNQHSIQVNDLVSGVYLIQINAGNVLPQTYKFVKI